MENTGQCEAPCEFWHNPQRPPHELEDRVPFSCHSVLGPGAGTVSRRHKVLNLKDLLAKEQEGKADEQGT